jgi:hypothetical protein
VTTEPNTGDYFNRFYPRLTTILAAFSAASGANKDGHAPRLDVHGLAAAFDDAQVVLHEYFGLTAPKSHSRDVGGILKSLEEVAAVVKDKEHGIMGGGAELSRLILQCADQIRNAAGKKGLDTTDVSRFSNVAGLRTWVFEAMNSIYGRVFALVKFVSPDPRQAQTFFDSETVMRAAPDSARKLVKASVADLQGWCSNAKSWLIYDLVRKSKPQVSVEVGIFGGRSLSIIAQALRDNESGIVYGIETWSGASAIRYRQDLANDFWWQNIDFIGIKRQFYKFFLEHHLIDVTKVIELSSEQAFQGIPEIDFLHIDGNHSMFGAAQDVVNYFGKLKRGGYVIFDDINWASTCAGLEILMDTAELVATVPIADDSPHPGCAAFRKI